jgi:hypothetical protein
MLKTTQKMGTCTYSKENKRRYMSGMASEQRFKTLEEAKTACDKSDQCAGLTREKGGLFTMRQQIGLNPSNADESSWEKSHCQGYYGDEIYPEDLNPSMPSVGMHNVKFQRTCSYTAGMTKVYISGYAKTAGRIMCQTTLDLAKQMCTRFMKCAGITKELDGMFTLRSGKKTSPSTQESETSWLKDSCELRSKLRA